MQGVSLCIIPIEAPDNLVRDVFFSTTCFALRECRFLVFYDSILQQSEEIFFLFSGRSKFKIDLFAHLTFALLKKFPRRLVKHRNKKHKGSVVQASGLCERKK